MSSTCFQMLMLPEVPCASYIRADMTRTYPFCRIKTLYEMFNELHSSPVPAPSEARRQPVCLLLGGGMAAGKSTVREIIGNDSFWSKARQGRV